MHIVFDADLKSQCSRSDEWMIDRNVPALVTLTYAINQLVHSLHSCPVTLHIVHNLMAESDYT